MLLRVLYFMSNYILKVTISINICDKHKKKTSQASLIFGIFKLYALSTLPERKHLEQA